MDQTPWAPPGSPTGSPPPNIPNYLVLAIVSIFCCWPLAIVAIINATKVNQFIAEGNIGAATEASNKAKKWSYIAIGLGVAWIVCVFIIWIIMIAMGAMTSVG